MPRKYKKTSVSLEPELIEIAKRRAAECGFKTSFSAYLAQLIEKDIKQDADSKKEPPPDRVVIASSARPHQKKVLKQRERQ